MKHIILLGDSIFDNAGYVDKGDSVIEQLQANLDDDCQATLLAVDGDVTKDVYAQLEKIPSDATHIILSVGGNDALRIINILSEPISSIAEALEMFTEINREFHNEYQKLLKAISNKADNLIVCTVYDSVPDFKAQTLTALAFYNEIILKQAFAIKASIIDLRLLCDEDRDYSTISPIEPSKHGAKKIVEMINLATQAKQQTKVFF
jgi:lysophospholipase L1-like esterase